MEAMNAIATFVQKTYQMVDDPSTDLIIKWGRENNTFVVTDPCNLARLLLPIYFKHSNFSSFVRQLNTYGFKKVDPDKWEFANESFLRGQIHLLKNIVRRRYSRCSYNIMQPKQDYGNPLDEKELSNEVMRLRREDSVLGEELEMINKRLRAAERRPQQMMAFLLKIAEDPETLSRVMRDKEKEIVPQKKKRRIVPSSLVATCSQNIAQSTVDTAVPLADTITGGSPHMAVMEDWGGSISEATQKSSFPFSLLA